jgi:hypothetical protein
MGQYYICLQFSAKKSSFFSKTNVRNDQIFCLNTCNFNKIATFCENIFKNHNINLMFNVLPLKVTTRGHFGRSVQKCLNKHIATEDGRDRLKCT